LYIEENVLSTVIEYLSKVTSNIYSPSWKILFILPAFHQLFRLLANRADNQDRLEAQGKNNMLGRMHIALSGPELHRYVILLASNFLVVLESDHS
jgi:hypothetical protein